MIWDQAHREKYKLTLSRFKIVVLLRTAFKNKLKDNRWWRQIFVNNMC